MPVDNFIKISILNTFQEIFLVVIVTSIVFYMLIGVEVTRSSPEGGFPIV
jgi:hypothetical protein